MYGKQINKYMVLHWRMASPNLPSTPRAGRCSFRFRVGGVVFESFTGHTVTRWSQAGYPRFVVTQGEETRHCFRAQYDFHNIFFTNVVYSTWFPTCSLIKTDSDSQTEHFFYFSNPCFGYEPATFLNWASSDRSCNTQFFISLKNTSTFLNA